MSRVSPWCETRNLPSGLKASRARRWSACGRRRGSRRSADRAEWQASAAEDHRCRVVLDPCEIDHPSLWRSSRTGVRRAPTAAARPGSDLMRHGRRFRGGCQPGAGCKQAPCAKEPHACLRQMRRIETLGPVILVYPVAGDDEADRTIAKSFQLAGSLDGTLSIIR